MKFRLAPLILANVVLTTLPALAGEVIDVTRDAEENEVVDIELINANITITGWDSNQVRFRGELSDDAQGYDFSSDNGITVFEEVYEDRQGFFGGKCSNWFNCRNEYDRTELDVSLPANSTLRLEGINVDLEISGMTGNTQIEIVNGPVKARDLTGRINLETVNGPIDTSDLNGRISLSTVNGRIRDRNSGGNRVAFSTVNGNIFSNTQADRVDSESVSGNVELVLGGIDDLEASSVSGRLVISLDLLEGGHVELSNVSGDVELLVNPEISARFDINTAVGGDIDNDLTDHEALQENRFVNSSELQFSINGGAGNVDISTVTGDILIGPK